MANLILENYLDIHIFKMVTAGLRTFIFKRHVVCNH